MRVGINSKLAREPFLVKINGGTESEDCKAS